jgi:cell division control protein 24
MDAPSLFQQSLRLMELLYRIPEMDRFLFPAGPPTVINDPISVLWHAFRAGGLLLVGQLAAPSTIVLDTLAETPKGVYSNACKKAVYQFIVICKQSLGFVEEDLFSISELYKDDTNCFVKVKAFFLIGKVIMTVEKVLQKLLDMELLPPEKYMPFSLPAVHAPEAPKNNRDKLIKEILDTERIYVKYLEDTQRYQLELLHQQLLPKPIVASIFANLEHLLDFQRRFLLAMESTLSKPMEEQRLGALFLLHEKHFEIYEPYCANYDNAIQVVQSNVSFLQKLSHLIEPHGKSYGC